jgi:hypothetical protein
MIGSEKIPGCDRVAIRPPRVMSQMESVCFFVWRDFPSLGDSGDGMEIMRILGDESLQESREDVKRTHPVHDVRIKVLHFFAISFVEDLETIPLIDRGLRAAA